MRKSLRGQIQTSLETFLEGVLRLGGEGSLVFEKPLKKSALPKRLPPGAAEVFTTIAGRIAIDWHLDEAVQRRLPRVYEECVFGDLDLHPKCFERVTKKWTSHADPIWCEKTVFAPDGSGDYLGIDADGRIVYLAHDLDPDVHGLFLAENLGDLLTRWAKLGCVGPTGVALRPFVRKGLDPRGAAAKRFVKVFAGSKKGVAEARRGKHAALVARVEAICRDPSGALQALSAAFRPQRNAARTITERYGRQPSPELKGLLRLDETGSGNPFVDAIADILRMDGALTGTWPFGRERGVTYLAEVDAGSSEVSVRHADGHIASAARSLTVFAQLDAVSTALENVAYAKWKKSEPQHAALRASIGTLAPALAPYSTVVKTFAGRCTFETKATRLAERADGLRHLFGHDSTFAHLPRAPSETPPARVADLACADALFWLWTIYLHGAPNAAKRLRAADHPAGLVRGAAALLDGLSNDARNPAAFLVHARAACQSGKPPEAPREAKVVAALPKNAERDRDPGLAWANYAYSCRCDGRWDELLGVSQHMRDQGMHLGQAWVDYAYALQGVGRSDDALRTADQALLHVDGAADELYQLKATVLMDLGERDAAIDHVRWLAPPVRVNLRNHTKLAKACKAAGLM